MVLPNSLVTVSLHIIFTMFNKELMMVVNDDLDDITGRSTVSLYYTIPRFEDGTVHSDCIHNRVHMSCSDQEDGIAKN